MRARDALLFLFLLLFFFVVGCRSTMPAKTKTSASRRVVSLSPWPGVRLHECKEDIAVPRQVEMRTSACEDGDLHACARLLVEDRPSESVAAKALATLDSGCKTGSVCACALYGSGLTFDRKRRFDERALDVLDEACSDGALPACDDLTILAEICSEGRDERVLCDKLRLAGLGQKRPSEQPTTRPLYPTPLATYLQDCFVVMRDLGADKCSVDPSIPSAESEVGGICEIDPAACPHSYPNPNPARAWICPKQLPEIGSVYCFGPERVLFRKKKTDAWTHWEGRWAAAPGGERFYGPNGTVVRLDGREALLGERYRMPRADERTKASALATSVVCDHAKRCFEAIHRMGSTERASDDIELDAPDAPEESFPTDPKRCAALEAHALHAVKRPLPEACR